MTSITWRNGIATPVTRHYWRKLTEPRVLLTKDHDIGALVFRDAAQHAGVVLFDDLGDPRAKCRLVIHALREHEVELAGAAFLRVSEAGVRQGKA
jgi:hypothetical protein